jgi:hypothetical protein
VEGRVVKPLLHPVPWSDKNGAWSVFIKNKKVVSAFETLVEIKYLSEDDNLYTDVKFELYEDISLWLKVSLRVKLYKEIKS